jgi:hypothetical protein
VTDRSTLHIDLRLGQSVRIGDAVVRLEKKHGQAARLRITAPPGLGIKKSPGAQECASFMKEQANGQHFV